MSTRSARPVVVGYDGTPVGDVALEWAVREANRLDLPLQVLVVSGISYAVAPGFGAASTWPEEVHEEVLGRVRTRVEALAPGEHVIQQKTFGTPAAELVLASADASTVVVGRHHRSALGELVAGSTSAQVVAHASCPVVVVDENHTTEVTAPIVVAVDGSPANDAALAFAFERASSTGAPLVAVHGWSVDVPATFNAAWLTEEYVGEVERSHERTLDDAVGTWSTKYPEVDVRKVLRRDLPVDAVLSCADGAQLIVVGSRGHGGFVGLLVGSVSQGLLHHRRRPCPLAVIHAERPES